MLRTFFQTSIGVITVGITAVDFTEISAAKTGLIGLGAAAFSAGLSALMNLESGDNKWKRELTYHITTELLTGIR